MVEGKTFQCGIKTIKTLTNRGEHKMKISLAAALLRRKELQQKVDQLRPINTQQLYQVKVARKNVTDSVDDIVAQVPLVKFEQVTASFDWHARRLREIDLAIQQANHMTQVEVGDNVMDDYIDKTDISKR